MPTFIQQQATAAKWMYDRKDPAKYWRWHVLTAHNPDPDTLCLTDLDAGNVFANLVHDGLLTPTWAPDGIEAYSINPGKDHLWRQIIHPRRRWWRKTALRLVEWLVSGLIGAVIGAVLTAALAR